MGQPTTSDVHADAALTDFSIAYVQDQKNFVAGDSMPWFPVEHKSDLYFIFNKDDWMRDDAVKVRAEGEGAPRSGFTLSKNNYNCTPWWTSVPLSQMVTANADPAVQLDRAAAQLVTQRMLIRRERIFATTFMVANVWANTLDGTADGGTGFTSWDDYASDPEKDIDTAKNIVAKSTGFVPNCLTVAYTVHQALKRHPLIVDRVKYSSDESITADIIKRFFELDEYNVTKAAYSTSNEGAVTKVQSFTVGPHALLTYKEGTPTIMSPTAAVVFGWSGLTGLNNMGVRIDQFYDQDKKEDVVRGEFAFDMIATGTDLGYLFTNAATQH
jgi:hypothetical protein